MRIRVLTPDRDREASPEPGERTGGARARPRALPLVDGGPAPERDRFLHVTSAALVSAVVAGVLAGGLVERIGDLPLDLSGRIAFLLLLISAMVGGGTAILPRYVARAGRAVRSLVSKGANGRVREALVCPYCRDEVDRRGTVVCARPKCGALYHRECWDECSKQYGGCAVYGCSSRRSKEVSAAGYVFRLARLCMAAVLFPPRLARAIKRTEAEGFVSSYRLALAKSREVHASWNATGNSQLPLIGVGVLASYALVVWALDRARLGNWILEHGWSMLLPLFAVPFLALLLPFVVALPLALGFYTAKTLARAFQAELAALGRADEGGTTVIGRLRLGLGKK